MGDSLSFDGAFPNSGIINNYVTNSFRKLQPMILNSVSKTGLERMRRKKAKKSKIVAEYQASQIPNNKGNTPLDDLVKFVNGIDSCHISKHQDFKTNQSHLRSEKRDHTLVGAKMETKNGERKTFSSSKVTHDDKEVFPGNISNDSLDRSSDINGISIADIVLEEDDAFFEVVRRKSRRFRQKKVDFKSCNITLPKKNENMARPGPDGFGRILSDPERDLVTFGDMKSLNSFINRLWMDFNCSYQEYLKNGSHG